MYTADSELDIDKLVSVQSGADLFYGHQLDEAAPPSHSSRLEKQSLQGALQGRAGGHSLTHVWCDSCSLDLFVARCMWESSERIWRQVGSQLELSGLFEAYDSRYQPVSDAEATHRDLV